MRFKSPPNLINEMNVVIYTRDNGFIRTNLEDINTIFSPVPPPIINITNEYDFISAFTSIKKDMTETILTFSFNPSLIEVLSKTKEIVLLSINEIHIYRGILVNEVGESYISVCSNYRQKIFNKSYKYVGRTKLNKFLYEQDK